jgi:hypothetical protein
VHGQLPPLFVTVSCLLPVSQCVLPAVLYAYAALAFLFALLTVLLAVDAHRLAALLEDLAEPPPDRLKLTVDNWQLAV